MQKKKRSQRKIKAGYVIWLILLTFLRIRNLVMQIVYKLSLASDILYWLNLGSVFISIV